MEKPESVSIGEIGEAIRQIVDCQISPGYPEAAISALEESHQRLTLALRTDTSAGAKVTDLLVGCKAAVRGASEALTTTRGQLTDYLDRIGAGAQNRGDLVSARPVSMTGETAAFQERPGPRDPHCAIGVDGTIRPRDPVNGEVMRPGEIPGSLLEDKELKTGFEFWQRHGPDVFLNLLFIKHASADSLAEAAIDLRAEARRLRQAGGVLFIEGVSGEGDCLEDFYSNLSYSPVAPAAALPAGQTDSPELSLEASIISQIAGTGVDTAVPDYYSDGNSQVDMTLAAWQSRIEATRSSINNMRDPGALLEACLEYEALAMGFAQYRDMYFIGRMGAELSSRYSVTGRLPGTASFLVGRLHENIGTILRGFGVRVSERGNAIDAHERQEIDCIRRSQITPADTEALMNSLAA